MLVVASQVSDFRKRGLLDLKQKITEERIRSKAIINLHVKEDIIVYGERNGTRVAFTYSYMDNLKKKYASASSIYPFLPPIEPGIFITNLSTTHRLLFNKFAVVKNHVLVVTSSYQEQTEPVNQNDFSAIFKVVSALKGLCIFNSGPHSGASQPHKHAQVMPMFKETKYSITKLLTKEAAQHEKPFKCSFFNFAHLVVPLPASGVDESFDDIGVKLELIYRELIKSLKIDTKQSSYNLILTEKWMMIVKRSKELAFDTLSVNSLGFIGTRLRVIRFFLFNFRSYAIKRRESERYN